MPSIADLNVRISLTDEASSGLDAMGNKVDQTAEQINQRGNLGALMVGGGMVAAGRAADRIMDAGISKAMDYSQAIADLYAVGGAEAIKNQDAIDRKIREVAANTKFNQTETAQGWTELSKAGLDYQDITEGALQASLELASAGDISVPDAAMETARNLTVFGDRVQYATDRANDGIIDTTDKLEHMNDVMVQASNISPASVAGLSDSMEKGSGSLSAIGQDYETGMALLTAAAFQGSLGQEAGTNMKSAINGILKNNEDIKEATGVSLFDDQGNAKDLIDYFTELDKATENMSEGERAANFLDWFDSYGQKFAQRMVDYDDLTGESLGDLEKRLINPGITAEVAAKKMDSLPGAIERINGAAENLSTAALTPFLEEVAKPAINKAAEWINNLSFALMDLPMPAKVAMGAVGVLGPALTTAAGAAIMAIPAFKWFNDGLAAMGASKGMIGKIGRTLPTVFKGIGLAGLLAAAGIAAYQTNFMGFGDWVDDTLTPAMEKAKSTFDYWLQQGVSPLEAGLRGIASFVGQMGLGDLGLDILDLVDAGRKAGDTWHGLGDSINPVAKALATASEFARQLGATNLADKLAQGAIAAQKFGTIFDTAMGNRQYEGMNALAAGVSALGEAISQVSGYDVRGVFDGLAQGIQWVGDNIPNAIQGIGQFKDAIISGDWSGAASQLQAGLQTALNFGQQAVDATADFLVNVIPGAIEFVGNLAGDIHTALRSWLAEQGNAYAGQGGPRDAGPSDNTSTFDLALGAITVNVGKASEILIEGTEGIRDQIGAAINEMLYGKQSQNWLTTAGGGTATDESGILDLSFPLGQINVSLDTISADNINLSNAGSIVSSLTQMVGDKVREMIVGTPSTNYLTTAGGGTATEGGFNLDLSGLSLPINLTGLPNLDFAGALQGFQSETGFDGVFYDEIETLVKGLMDTLTSAIGGAGDLLASEDFQAQMESTAEALGKSLAVAVAGMLAAGGIGAIIAAEVGAGVIKGISASLMDGGAYDVGRGMGTLTGTGVDFVGQMAKGALGMVRDAMASVAYSDLSLGEDVNASAHEAGVAMGEAVGGTAGKSFADGFVEGFKDAVGDQIASSLPALDGIDIQNVLETLWDLSSGSAPNAAIGTAELALQVYDKVKPRPLDEGPRWAPEGVAPTPAEALSEEQVAAGVTGDPSDRLAVGTLPVTADSVNVTATNMDVANLPEWYDPTSPMSYSDQMRERERNYGYPGPYVADPFRPEILPTWDQRSGYGSVEESRAMMPTIQPGTTTPTSVGTASITAQQVNLSGTITPTQQAAGTTGTVQNAPMPSTTSTMPTAGMASGMNTAAPAAGASPTSGMAGAIQADMQAAQQAVTQGMTQIQTAITTGTSQIQSAVTALSTAVSTAFQGLTSAVQSAASSVESAIQQIISALNAAAGQAEAAARSIGEGIVRGLDSMTGAVTEAAGRLASAAQAGIQGVVQMGSPSKMAIPYGQSIGEGLGYGMEQSSPEVLAAAEKLGYTAEQGLQPLMDGMSAAGLAAGQALGVDMEQALATKVNGLEGWDPKSQIDYEALDAFKSAAVRMEKYGKRKGDEAASAAAEGFKGLADNMSAVLMGTETYLSDEAAKAALKSYRKLDADAKSKLPDDIGKQLKETYDEAHITIGDVIKQRMEGAGMDRLKGMKGQVGERKEMILRGMLGQRTLEQKAQAAAEDGLGLAIDSIKEGLMQGGQDAQSAMKQAVGQALGGPGEQAKQQMLGGGGIPGSTGGSAEDMAWAICECVSGANKEMMSSLGLGDLGTQIGGGVGMLGHDLSGSIGGVGQEFSKAMYDYAKANPTEMHNPEWLAGAPSVMDEASCISICKDTADQMGQAAGGAAGAALGDSMPSMPAMPGGADIGKAAGSALGDQMSNQCTSLCGSTTDDLAAGMGGAVEDGLAQQAMKEVDVANSKEMGAGIRKGLGLGMPGMPGAEDALAAGAEQGLGGLMDSMGGGLGTGEDCISLCDDSGMGSAADEMSGAAGDMAGSASDMGSQIESLANSQVQQKMGETMKGIEEGLSGNAAAMGDIPPLIKQLNPNIDRALNFDIADTNPHAAALMGGGGGGAGLPPNIPAGALPSGGGGIKDSPYYAALPNHMKANPLVAFASQLEMAKRGIEVAPPGQSSTEMYGGSSLQQIRRYQASREAQEAKEAPPQQININLLLDGQKVADVVTQHQASGLGMAMNSVRGESTMKASRGHKR